MYHTWVNAVTKPSETTYREEVKEAHATLSTALIWVFIASVMLGVLSAVAILVNGLLFNTPMMMGTMFGNSNMPSEVNEQFGQMMLATIGINLVFSLILTPIITPIAFMIGSAIYFVIAKLLGGVGDFEKHTYILATFSAPLLVVNGALSIIPVLGGCISIVVYIYQAVLTYFAFKSVHELSAGKAILVALSPLLMILLCATLWGVTLFSVLSFSALNN